MNSTEFCERHVLPLVLAFALGVIAMKVSTDRQELQTQVLAQEAMDLTDRAIEVAELYRTHCEVFEHGVPIITVVRDARHD